MESKRKNLMRLLYVSAVSMLFQAVSNADLGIIGQFTSQNGNDWAGSLSTALIFLGSGLGSLYNRYIHRFPFRLILFGGSLGWTAFLSFSIIFLFVGFSNLALGIVLLGSFACGLLVSVYYNGVFNYVNDCSKADSQPRYFGINMALTQSANIIGSLISTFLIEPLTQKVYSIVMTATVLAISLGFLAVTNAIQMKAEEGSQEQNEGKALQIEHSETEVKDRVPWYFLFTFGFSGVMISFVYSEFSLIFFRAFPEMGKEELNKLTFTAFLIQGVGELIGGILAAVFSLRFKSISCATILNGQVFLLACVLVYFGEIYSSFALLSVGAFIIGVANCNGFTLCLMIAGKWNAGGYSVFNLGQSATVAVVVIANIFLSFPYLLILYAFAHLASCLPLIAHKERVQSGK